MADEIITTRKGPVLEITLNRPEIGNAASDAMAVELTKLLLGAGENAEIVVLRGAGDDFCVGRETMGKRPPGAQPDALELRRRNDVVFNCYGAFRRCEIPVIGVVKGRAFGFGCAIAAVCDITLAADTAKFQVPEMAHNIMPTMVMSALVDRVPRKAMTYLVWSTAVISPARAREAGIVSEIFPAAELEPRSKLVRADHAGAAAGAGRLQGLCARRPRHGCAGAIEYARSIHAVINSSRRDGARPRRGRLVRSGALAASEALAICALSPRGRGLALALAARLALRSILRNPAATNFSRLIGSPLCAGSRGSTPAKRLASTYHCRRGGQLPAALGRIARDPSAPARSRYPCTW